MIVQVLISQTVGRVWPEALETQIMNGWLLYSFVSVLKNLK